MKQKSPRHTPGKWQVSKLMRQSTAYDIVSSIGRRVAMVRKQDGISPPKTRANAYLLAAAPELLELLKAISNNPEILTESAEFCQRIDDAIAEAEGR